MAWDHPRGEGEARAAGVLREAYELQGFSRMDPIDGQWLDPAFSAVYETLLVGAGDGKVEPALASSLEADADHLGWTLTLPPSITFHSGTPCDAAAVALVLDAARDPSQGVNASMWGPVKGVEVIDSTTLHIVLDHPYANLPNVLRSYHTAVFNDASRRSLGSEYGNGTVDATGPFLLSRWETDLVEARRWDSYPGSNAPSYGNGGIAHLRAIQWLAIPDDLARVEALEQGTVDCVRALPAAMVDRVVAHEDLAVASAEEDSGYYLALNFQRADLRFDDARVRRAVSHAIDRNALVDRVFGGYATPGYGPAGPGYVYYEPKVEATNKFDPRLAAQLLDDAGLGLDDSGVRIVCDALAPDWPEMRACADAVAEMLARVGVVLRFDHRDPTKFFYDLESHPPAFLSRWLWPDQLDAIAVFSASRAQPVPNWQFASIGALDHVYEEFDRASDDAGLRTAAQQAQLLVSKDLPYIPLATPHAIWAHHRDVVGWQPQGPNLYHPYHDVRISDTTRA